jgi:hypothetical protein
MSKWPLPGNRTHHKYVLPLSWCNALHTFAEMRRLEPLPFQHDISTRNPFMSIATCVNRYRVDRHFRICFRKTCLISISSNCKKWSTTWKLGSMPLLRGCRTRNKPLYKYIYRFVIWSFMALTSSQLLCGPPFLRPPPPKKDLCWPVSSIYRFLFVGRQLVFKSL